MPIFLRKAKSLLKIIIIYFRNKYISKKDFKILFSYINEFPKVLSTSETLKKILDNRLSVARFGDGEFDKALKLVKYDTYQMPSEELSNKLFEILKSDDERILICIPPFSQGFTVKSKAYRRGLDFWSWHWLQRFDLLKNHLIKNIYGNSLISRQEVFLENSIELVKKLWEGRDVVFVYGKNGRFHKNSILFDNINSYFSIESIATNAFSELSNLVQQCVTFDKSYLFLLALGPTATVLSYELTQLGYQALDIGHLPNSFDQFNGKIDSPEKLPFELTSKNEFNQFN